MRTIHLMMTMRKLMIRRIIPVAVYLISVYDQQDRMEGEGVRYISP